MGEIGPAKVLSHERLRSGRILPLDLRLPELEGALGYKLARPSHFTAGKTEAQQEEVTVLSR